MTPGIYAATLTPVTADLQPDAPRAIAYCRDLLARGCDGVAILGTTGEAMSFSADQRLRFMNAIAEALPVERVACGTGAAALADAARLTQGAHDLGFAAAFVLPPFFYRDADDDGIVSFFGALLSRLDAQHPRLLLYNFPRMSGVTFHAALVDRLLREYPGVFFGMKESSNDRTLQRALVARHDGFLVFPGSEHYLLEAMTYGAAGCISGSVCLWPELAQEVYRARDAVAGEELARLRASIGGRFIATVRSRVAKATGDAAWRVPLPPLHGLPEHVLEI